MCLSLHSQEDELQTPLFFRTELLRLGSCTGCCMPCLVAPLLLRYSKHVDKDDLTELLGIGVE